MGHFSMEKSLNPGSALSGNQQPRDETGGWATNWTVYHEVMSSTRLDVRFIKGLDSQRSPNGAYVVLMRNADA